jgi:CubicO group peptidase (beta-lactamase class C family)
VSEPDATRVALEALMGRLLARRHVHHVAMGATSIDGSWSWTDATGAADPDGEPMRADTPWFLASVTKLHIAAIILRLNERGLLDLDAPISALLPDDLGQRLHVHGGTDRTAQLTPVHLLGHLSGLPDYLEERPRGASSLIDDIVAVGDRAWTPEQAVVRARDQLTPHFPPSDPDRPRPKLRYSDTNYQLLVVIAQQAAGRPIAELHRDLLFQPLELRHTWVPGHEPLDPAPDPATVWLGEKPLDDRPLAMASFGDLYSTTDDLLRFGRALFARTLFDHPDTAALMHRRFHRFGFPRSLATIRAPSWPIEYGLGLMRFELNRLLAGGLRLPTLIGHTGSTGSWLWHLPELDLIVAGTVDQTTAATVPFRPLPRALARLRP